MKSTRKLTLIATLLLLLLLPLGCDMEDVLPTPISPLEAALDATPSPESTATPLPPQPPQLLAQSPARGEELALDAPIELVFDQPMDRPSVEAAFAIDPEVEGQFDWLDDETVRFVPEPDALQRDRLYTVSVDTTAASAQDQDLAREITFRVRTVGYVEVADVFPQPDNDDVDPESDIIVVFNRPIVPLTAIREQEDLLDPLRIEPATEGEGVWTNTSIYTFTPADGLLAGTTYTLTIPAGLESAGAVLDEDYVWSFTVAPPAVTAITPTHRSLVVAPDAEIVLTFNQTMDTDSVESLFALQAAETEQAVSGTTQWDDTTLRFVPDEPLTRGTRYEIHLQAGSQTAAGEATIDQDNLWEFRVAPPARVVGTSPADGSMDVEPWGSMRIDFSAPMDTASVQEALSITPTVRTYAFWQENDTELWVSWGLDPSTAYTVTVSTEATDRFGEPLAETASWGFETRPLDPAISLLTQGPIGIYRTGTDTGLSVRYVNVSRLDFELFTLEPQDLIDLTRDGGWPDWDRFSMQSRERVARWSQGVDADLNVWGVARTTFIPASDGILPSGLYVLATSAPEAGWTERHIVVVTSMNLTLKTTQDEALVWATALSDGQPLRGLEITLYGADGRRADEGVTDADGLLRLDMPEQERWESVLVMASDGDGLGAVSDQWSDGVAPWALNLPVAWEIQDYRGHFFTERRIYRPGQTVFFKGFLRADDDGRYTLPPGDMPVEALLMDSQGREVWQGTLSLNDVGAVDGQFPLSDSASLGFYTLIFQYGDQYMDTSFQVAEYRRPEFQVAVTVDDDEVIAGDTLDIEVQAEFFLGGPVSDADVLWRMVAEPYAFDRYEGQGYYSFEDYDYGDPTARLLDLGLVSEGRGQTDEAGRLSLSIPTELEGFSSRRMVVQVSVVDIDNQEITGQVSAIVHKGDLYVGLTAERYVGVANDEMPIGIVTVDTQGAPLARQSVDIVVARHEWYSVQQQGEDGGFYWENKVRQTPVHTETVRTNAQGMGQLVFTPPEGGTYKVLASAQDSADNEVRSALFVWVSGAAYVNWGQQNHNRIDLVADKMSYLPGETASILIPSPFDEPVTALLTIERGRILEHRLIELESNSEVLELPIEADYAPNIFVSVVLIRGMGEDLREPGYRVGYVMLTVPPDQFELAVSITPDRQDTYQPGDTVTYTITTADYQEQLVEAEVVVQLVDLAIETLVGGAPPSILDTFYRERGLAVNTALSLVRRRLPEDPSGEGDGKGGGGGEDGGLRTEFPETALWAPSVRTDADGYATVSVTLPDNLTTWRLTAQAMTVDARVGRGQVDIVSNLSVMVRPSVPRFLVIGDEAVLGAVVHNNTDADLEIDLMLEAEGITLSDSDQTVQVPAGGRTAVEWPAVVGPVEEAVLTYSAQGGGHQDATRITIPVYHATTPEVVGTSGMVEDRVIETVRLPDTVAPGQGGLTLNLEPSLAAAMQEGLDYLRTFLYDCVEQTISRFLPNIATSRALSELGLEDSELETRVTQQVALGLQRLYTTQGNDGGWGWWAGGESSPVITAYALFGLAQARDSGYLVYEPAMDRAVEFLYDWMNREQPDNQDAYDTRAVALYALAEVGEGDLGRTIALFETRDELSLFARGYLAMSLYLLEPDEPGRMGTLVDELVDAGIMSATGLHWEEETQSRWQMNTDTRTTAIVLRALVWIDPDLSLLPQAVRWLTMARSSGRWETTQENVWSILALTDYMVATGELDADYAYSAIVNGQEMAEGTVDGDNLAQVVGLTVPMDELLIGQNNHVIIERVPQDAPGRLYYSAFLEYFLPIEEIEALDRGVMVHREYTLADRPDEPITSARVNDIITVRLTLIAPRDLYYLVFEDPFPAGCEALDPSLATTRRIDEEMSLMRAGSVDEFVPWWSRSWPTHTELRDEKLALFATHLPRGTYEYAYQLRCTTPGVFRVIPSLAYQMYEPDIFGRSAGELFEVAQ